MLDMKEFFKQTTDNNNENANYIYITPTTIIMWFIGLFLVIFAAINGFF